MIFLTENNDPSAPILLLPKLQLFPFFSKWMQLPNARTVKSVLNCTYCQKRTELHVLSKAYWIARTVKSVLNWIWNRHNVPHSPVIACNTFWPLDSWSTFKSHVTQFLFSCYIILNLGPTSPKDIATAIAFCIPANSLLASHSVAVSKWYSNVHHQWHPSPLPNLHTMHSSYSVIKNHHCTAYS